MVIFLAAKAITHLQLNFTASHADLITLQHLPQLVNLISLELCLQGAHEPEWEHLEPACCAQSSAYLAATVTGLTSDQLQAMEQAWPEIRDLHIHVEWDLMISEETSCVSLGSLECFALHCRNLERLRIDVDTRITAEGNEHLGSSFVPALGSLTYVNFGTSRSFSRESAPRIAFIIDELWPKLETGEAWSKEDGGWVVQEEETWTMIWELVSARRHARERERLRQRR